MGMRDKPRNACLESLVAMGTETGLVQLSLIANKARSNRIRPQARRCWNELATCQGLSSEELAEGALVLDFGSRSFGMGVDVRRKSCVVDKAVVERRQTAVCSLMPGSSTEMQSSQRRSSVKLNLSSPMEWTRTVHGPWATDVFLASVASTHSVAAERGVVNLPAHHPLRGVRAFLVVGVGRLCSSRSPLSLRLIAQQQRTAAVFRQWLMRTRRRIPLHPANPCRSAFLGPFDDIVDHDETINKVDHAAAPGRESERPSVSRILRSIGVRLSKIG